MARIKIDYGIDLGTTNSAICRMEKGEPVIKKSDTLKDTMPSCVSINKKQSVRVGDTAYNEMKADKRRATKSWKIGNSNSYVEFKRSMGTDKQYESSFLGRSLSSEELSSEVLKTLKTFVADETIKSVVITVPAKFTVNQIAATKKAAKLSGFEHCEILQEPVAASFAYGLSSGEKAGNWMVFDFGGGTFDAALLKVEDGIMQVFDTEGDNYLGGKNLDYAIVDEIIIPYLKENYAIEGILADIEKKEILRDAMKTYVEDLRIQLSFKDSEDILSNIGDLGSDDDGEEFELDLTVNQEQAFAVMKPIYQKAVNICKELLHRNNMTGEQVSRIILVGGPTYCPLIREMIREQVSQNVDTSIDPMTAVAQGAALYASTIDAEVKDEDVEIGTIRLNVGYESTSAETVEYVSMQLDKSATSVNCPDSVYIEIVRDDNAWSSGKQQVTTSGTVIDAQLREGKANSFSINCYDNMGNSLDCFPNEITILQGPKVSDAPLPYHIGIEIWNPESKKLVFTPISGLEKNKPLPAIGTENTHKTTSPLRPGNSDDKLVIPIFQADDGYVVGASSKLYEYIGDIVIDGNDVETLVPEDSVVELTIRVSTSQDMILEAYIPSCDLTIEKELKIGTNEQLEKAKTLINDNFSSAERTLQSLEKDGINVEDLRTRLDEAKKENSQNTETKMVLQHQKEVLRDIEKREHDSEFERVEKELRRMFQMTEEDQKKYGTFITNQELERLRTLTDEAINKRDPKFAKDVIDQLQSLDYDLALVEYFEAWIMGWHKRFEQLAWKDKPRARTLLNQAIGVMNDAPTSDKLRPYVQQLIALLPDSQVPADAKGRLH